MKPVMLMKTSMLSGSAEGVLSRSEMKNIMAGSCEWSGCSGSSAVFNCWHAECTATYSGQDAMDCASQVNESWLFAIDMCGASYS